MQNEVAWDKNKPRIVLVRNKLGNLSSKQGMGCQVCEKMHYLLNWKWNKVKTESMTPIIRQMLDRKFLEWNFCDDKTKCFPPLWYLQHLLEKYRVSQMWIIQCINCGSVGWKHTKLSPVFPIEPFMCMHSWGQYCPHFLYYCFKFI